MPSVINNVPGFLARILTIRAGLFILGTIFSSTLAALSGMKWAQADTQTQIMVIIGVAGTVCTTLGAYIDTTASRVAKGDLPFIDAPNSEPEAPTKTISVTESHTQTDTTKVTAPAAS